MCLGEKRGGGGRGAEPRLRTYQPRPVGTDLLFEYVMLRRSAQKYETRRTVFLLGRDNFEQLQTLVDVEIVALYAVETRERR